MKKRYSIPKEQCVCGITDRKISITKKVLDYIFEFYHSQNCDDETIATWMLLYGPKADLEGEGCEFEIEDGFVAKGV